MALTRPDLKHGTAAAAGWVVVLFALNSLLQRVSIPFLPIPITVLVTLGWLLLALRFGVVKLHRRRLLIWLFAAGGSALVVIPQLLLVRYPFVSFNSWAYWMVVWLPLVVQLRDRGEATYARCLRGIAYVGLGLSALSLTFIVVQLLGFGYRDWFAEVVPRWLQVPGYIVSYPLHYDSELYKSNGWLALEPSFLSFMIGVSLICALALRLRLRVVVVLLAGLLSTTAGSGLALLVIYLVVTVLTGGASHLRRYALPGALLAVVFSVSVLGQSIVGRLSEAGAARSSTSLRAIEPYIYLWPQWISDPAAVLVGRGAGSSAWLVENSGIDGLLVTNLAKVIFDYGLLGGSCLVVLMAASYQQAPNLAIAAALAVSMFTLQSASPPLVVCSFLVVSLWAPLVRAPAGPGYGVLAASAVSPPPSRALIS